MTSAWRLRRRSRLTAWSCRLLRRTPFNCVTTWSSGRTRPRPGKRQRWLIASAPQSWQFCPLRRIHKQLSEPTHLRRSKTPICSVRSRAPINRSPANSGYLQPCLRREHRIGANLLNVVRCQPPSPRVGRQLSGLAHRRGRDRNRDDDARHAQIPHARRRRLRRLPGQARPRQSRGLPMLTVLFWRTGPRLLWGTVRQTRGWSAVTQRIDVLGAEIRRTRRRRAAPRLSRMACT